MNINKLSENIKSLTQFEIKNHESIVQLETKLSLLEDQIKQTELKKYQIEQDISKATEQLNHIEQSGLDKLNAIKEKLTSVRSFFEKTPILSIMNTFLNDPTTQNLQSLVQGMNNHTDYLKSAEKIDLINQIGEIYPQIGIAHSALAQTEQSRSAIIADCDQYIDENAPAKESFSQAATTAFKKLSSVLETKPQSKQIEVVSDLIVIKALKSYLSNDDKAKQSFGIIAKFIQSSIDEETTVVSRLITKASEIDSLIKSIYTAKQEEKMISAGEPTASQTTLTFKTRLQSSLAAEEKRDDNISDSKLV